MNVIRPRPWLTFVKVLVSPCHECGRSANARTHTRTHTHTHATVCACGKTAALRRSARHNLCRFRVNSESYFESSFQGLPTALPRQWVTLGVICNRFSTAHHGGGLLLLSGSFCTPFSHTCSRMKLKLFTHIGKTVANCSQLARLQPKASGSSSQPAGSPPAGSLSLTGCFTGCPRDSLCITNETGA